MFMVNDLLNETDEDGNTPLHLAAAKLHSSILVSPSNEGNEGTDGNQAQATPNKTGCAGDEKIEAKKEKRFHLWPPLLQQRTIEILKAASAKQAKKLEGILEQEDLIIESIRERGVKKWLAPSYANKETAFKAFIVTDTVAMTTSMTAAVILFTSSWNDEKNKWNLHFIALQLLWMSLAPMGLAFLTGLFTVLSHSMELAIMVCFIGYLFPSLLYLLGPLILPEEFVWSLVDIVEKIKTKIHSFCLFHSTMLGSLHSTVLVLVEANDSDLLVSLNNAGESPLFMAVDARASEIVKTILQKSNPYSLLHRSSTARRFYTGPF
ncbi:hypothetical protein CK203_105427 [Vitis vinifera]|uniref:PGG domain-containing protein n=1 Tax=Vitis vinifera TaxID=29760 RepID=A0A438CQL1_VITVI|nr:hypothetical protein CK203_105427 [Vitis vinifera]